MMLTVTHETVFPLDIPLGAWIPTPQGMYQVADTVWLTDPDTVAIPVHTTYTSDVFYLDRHSKITVIVDA